LVWVFVKSFRALFRGLLKTKGASAPKNEGLLMRRSFADWGSQLVNGADAVSILLKRSFFITAS